MRSLKKKNKKRQECSKCLNEILSKASESELTIYKSAVDNLIGKRDSSSSEDCLNSSDEIKLIELKENSPVENEHLDRESNHSFIEQFISDAREKQRFEGLEREGRRYNHVDDGQQPGLLERTISIKTEGT